MKEKATSADSSHWNINQWLLFLCIVHIILSTNSYYACDVRRHNVPYVTPINFACAKIEWMITTICQCLLRKTMVSSHFTYNYCAPHCTHIIILSKVMRLHFVFHAIVAVAHSCPRQILCWTGVWRTACIFIQLKRCSPAAFMKHTRNKLSCRNFQNIHNSQFHLY